MTTITERARAKINLTLRVLGRRADGYHLLESLIAFADVADDVIFDAGRRARSAHAGPYAAAIAGDNLVDTALDRIAAADPQARLGRVEVEKRLPIAAGIGGGSADAAAVLRAVRRANPRSLRRRLAVDRRLRSAPTCPSASPTGRRSCGATGERIERGRRAAAARRGARVPPQSPRRSARPNPCSAHLSVPRARRRPRRPQPLPSFADAAALVDYMRAIGNDLRAPAHARPARQRRGEAALAAAARLPLRQPLRRRADELWNFRRRATTPRRRPSSCAHASRLVDRRHRDRRLSD